MLNDDVLDYVSDRSYGGILSVPCDWYACSSIEEHHTCVEIGLGSMPYGGELCGNQPLDRGVDATVHAGYQCPTGSCLVGCLCDAYHNELEGSGLLAAFNFTPAFRAPAWRGPGENKTDCDGGYAYDLGHTHYALFGSVRAGRVDLEGRVDAVCLLSPPSVDAAAPGVDWPPATRSPAPLVLAVSPADGSKHCSARWTEVTWPADDPHTP